MNTWIKLALLAVFALLSAGVANNLLGQEHHEYARRIVAKERMEIGPMLGKTDCWLCPDAYRVATTVVDRDVAYELMRDGTWRVQEGPRLSDSLLKVRQLDESVGMRMAIGAWSREDAEYLLGILSRRWRASTP